MDAKAVNFVIEHLHEINKLTRLKDQVIDALDAKVLDKLDAEVPAQPIKPGPGARAHSCHSVSCCTVFV